MKSTRYVLPLLMIWSLGVSGQSLRKANRQFEKYNFTQAIVLYESILKKREAPEATINLAEAYRKTGDFENAERVYKKVVKLKESKPEHNLYYGQALLVNGKLDKAKKYLNKFNSAAPDDKRGQNMLKSSDKEVRSKLLSQGASYRIERVVNINSPEDDFSPAFYKNGIVFSSERANVVSGMVDHSWTGLPFLDLYYSKTEVTDIVNYRVQQEEPVKYARKLRTRFHDGPVVFTNKDRRIYFTRNNMDKGRAIKSEDNIVNLKIFTAAVSESGEWTSIEELPFNSSEYSVCHPAISKDGNMLIFSSDMPSGVGGMDLYMSKKQGKTWSKPENMGPSINTEGNEVFPFLQANGTLFFASDGHTGLGGLDMFSVNEKGDEPYNLGYPINTSADDFGLILNKKRTAGFFTSDRQGGQGRDDIYSFVRSVAPIKVLVYDKATGDPISEAKVNCICQNKELTTNEDGITELELNSGNNCEFSATKSGYLPDPYNKTLHLNNATQGVTTIVKVPLVKESNYALSGTVLDSKTKKPIAGALVILENTCGDNVKTIRADENGNYDFKVKAECCYFVKGSSKSYISATVDDLCPKGAQTNADIPLLAVNTPPADPAFNADAIAAGATIVLEHIYYDFDQSYIREEASIDLDKLLSIMKTNPNIIVEVGSHTDARGTTAYNTGLSQRRAKAVVDWLGAKGVHKKRLLYRGYGESQTLNGCADNVDCTEEEHQRNRRTEFRVVGTLDGKPVNQISIPPAKIKIDPCSDCSF